MGVSSQPSSDLLLMGKPSRGEDLRTPTAVSTASATPTHSLGKPRGAPDSGSSSLPHLLLHLPISSPAAKAAGDCGSRGQVSFLGLFCPFPASPTPTQCGCWASCGWEEGQEHPAACWQRPRTDFLNSEQQVGSLPAAAKGRRPGRL